MVKNLPTPARYSGDSSQKRTAVRFLACYHHAVAPSKSNIVPGTLQQNAGPAPTVYQPAPSREVTQARISIAAIRPASISPGLRNHPPKQFSAPPVYNPFPAAKPVQRHVSMNRTVIHPISAPAIGKVIQRARVGVGFDRMASAGEGDVLVTSGLANCIAVVAYDRTAKTAVMAHYNTLGFTTSKLEALRVTLAAELRRVVGAAVDPRYYVGLGGIWHNHDYNDNPNSAITKMWNVRQSLIEAIISVFGTEPTQCGTVIEFNVDKRKMRGNLSRSKKIAVPENWSTSGTAL